MSATFFGVSIGGPIFQLGKHHRLKIVVANVLMVAFVAGASQTSLNQRAAAVTCVAFAAASCAMLESAMQVWVAATRGADNIGLSLGLLGAFRALGGALAQAIYITVLNNKITDFLPQLVTEAALEGGLPQSSLPDLFAAIQSGSAAAFGQVPGMTAEIALVVQKATSQAYLETFRYIYYVIIAFGSLSAIFAFLMTKDLDENMTNYVPKTLKSGRAPTKNPDQNSRESFSETDKGEKDASRVESEQRVEVV